MADPPHIVVVEDEATQRQLLVEYLSRQHFRDRKSTRLNSSY